MDPIGLDLPSDAPDSFRRRVLLSLDLLRGLLLALHADENIALFLRSDQESDENWYSKQDRWTESPLYALRLLAVSGMNAERTGSRVRVLNAGRRRMSDALTWIISMHRLTFEILVEPSCSRWVCLHRTSFIFFRQE